MQSTLPLPPPDPEQNSQQSLLGDLRTVKLVGGGIRLYRSCEL